MKLAELKLKVKNLATIKHFIYDHVLSNNSALNKEPLIVQEYLYAEEELLKALNIDPKYEDEFLNFHELELAAIKVNDTQYYSFLKLIQNHEFMDKISSMTTFAEK